MRPQTELPPTGFGEQLRSVRERLGVSRDRLAALVGTTGQTIYRLEDGKHEPALPLALALARALGVTLVELVPGSDTVTPPAADVTPAPAPPPGMPGRPRKATPSAETAPRAAAGRKGSQAPPEASAAPSPATRRKKGKS
jgi:DNA-binding XRE family transcriptional regulator